MEQTVRPSVQNSPEKGDGSRLVLLALSMLIFGTIGIFVRFIGFPSSWIAMIRGYVGGFCLLAVLTGTHRGIHPAEIRRNLKLLVLSGSAIGFNWILLFEAYHYTTVATATLCYYMQPVFVTLFSALIFRERLTGKKLICILTALLGMSFLCGIWTAPPEPGEVRGILYGLGAGMLYASVILCNKKITGIHPLEQTVIQLFTAAAVVTPYALLTEAGGLPEITPASACLLLFVGIFHTGFAYTLFFGQIPFLPAQTVAIVSYVDPAAAVLLSGLILHETAGISGAAGAVLILGSALFSEMKLPMPGERHSAFSDKTGKEVQYENTRDSGTGCEGQRKPDVYDGRGKK